jgi:DNA-binding MarR family transcriptional regulator/GNAT superfamily N-acetyltransferase
METLAAPWPATPSSRPACAASSEIVDAVKQLIDDVNDMETGSRLDGRIEAVRRFNRFYTLEIGALGQSLLGSPFSLTEARVLYELARHEGATAADLGKQLRLDPGYLSRILSRFQQRGWLRRQRSTTDRRQAHLGLTSRGRKAFATLDRRTHAQVAALLGRASPLAQRRLVDAMRVIEGALGVPAASRSAAPLIRTHQPGDLGWMLERHAALYASEYGLDERFEGLVAQVTADFLAGHDPPRERCWIAELDGDRVGSILLVAKSKRVAQLRLLLVEPAARGHGIGRRLVDECVGFARQVGYRSITLWTSSALHAARRIYQAAGFRLTEESPHRLLGRGVVGQTWDLTL